LLITERKTNFKGNTSEFEKSMYNKFRPLRVMMIFLTILSLFVCKPAWCYDKGDEMQDDTCQEDRSGVQYNTLSIEYMNPLYIYVLQLVTELLVLVFYLMKMMHTANPDEKEVIFWSKCILFLCTGFSGLLYSVDISLPVHSILFILFLGVHK
jgi:hypothetical protein